MKTYICTLLVMLFLAHYNAIVLPYMSRALSIERALLQCVNGATFAVELDGKFFILKCESYENK